MLPNVVGRCRVGGKSLVRLGVCSLSVRGCEERMMVYDRNEWGGATETRTRGRSTLVNCAVDTKRSLQLPSPPSPLHFPLRSLLFSLFLSSHILFLILFPSSVPSSFFSSTPEWRLIGAASATSSAFLIRPQERYILSVLPL